MQETTVKVYTGTRWEEVEKVLNKMLLSSRRRHTTWNCDWSSDVCSSDIPLVLTCNQGGFDRVLYRLEFARSMKFSHLSDCHIGCWRDPKLKDLNLQAFEAALRQSLEAHVDFILIAGDLFHTSHPGRTMLDILEEAKLVKNVMRGTVADGTLRLAFTTDPKTGAKLTGVQGRKGMLERAYYEMLDREPLEQEPGFKIFLFH